MAITATLATKTSDGTLSVCIIGLGYVGLPTAIGFHDAGFEVWGVDVSQRTVDMVRAGENPTGDPDVERYCARTRHRTLEHYNINC